jgi:hypothetical protein
MRAYCVQCGGQFSTVKIGVVALVADGKGEPYQLWNADVLICDCEPPREIITNFGNHPYTQAGKEGFEAEVARVIKQREVPVYTVRL